MMAFSTLRRGIAAFLPCVLASAALANSVTDDPRYKPVKEAVSRYVAGDLGGARAAWSRACEVGNTSACYELAIMYRDGEGVSADPAQYQALLEKSCAGGFGSACFNLGNNLDRRITNGGDTAAKPSQSDLAVMLSWYDKGCVAGSAPSCANAGYARVHYAASAADRESGAKQLERACDMVDDQSSGPACRAAGFLHDPNDAAGVLPDRVVSDRYYTLGCLRGDNDSCQNLGYHYRLAMLSSHDARIKANTLYSIICDDGSEWACPMWTKAEYFSGGQSYTRDDVARDKREAAGLYQESCEAGFSIGCYALASLVFRSGHGAANIGQITTLLDRALTLDAHNWAARHLKERITAEGLAGTQPNLQR